MRLGERFADAVAKAADWHEGQVRKGTNVPYISHLLIVAGIVVYLAAFAQGPGPTMGDRPVQATLFTLATVLLVLGFAFVAVV